jgi:putative phosphoesterase
MWQNAAGLIKKGATYMTIVVISDTHIPGKAKSLPQILYNEIEKCDHIIHAGDVNDIALINELEIFDPVTVVAGNTDGYQITDKHGFKTIVELSGKRIGVVHGNGPRATFENVRRAFSKDNVDCVVYGHSHIPHCEFLDGILYFNPGSPTDKRLNKYYTYGLIKISEGEFYPEMIYFNKNGIVKRVKVQEE